MFPLNFELDRSVSYFAFLRANFRWLLAAYLLTFFSGFGQTYFISLFAGDIREEFGLSHGDVGGIYMLATLGSALALPWLGKLADDFSSSVTATGVMVGLTLACLGMALVPSVWALFVVIFALRLFGQGMMTHTALTAVSKWFSAQRGRAMSIAIMGFPSGEAILPVTFVALSLVIGWRNSWFVAAGLMVLVALPLILFLLAKERTPSAADNEARAAEGRQWTRSEVLKDPVFWIISAGILAPPCFGTAIMFHQAYLVELKGWTKELFASAFIVMAVFSVASSVLAGGLVDRYSARQLLALTLMPLMLGCFALASFTSPIVAFVYMGLLGMGNGFAATLIGALWPEAYGTRHVGAIRAVAFALMVFASAAGPGAMGWLIDAAVSYNVQVAGMGVYCLLMVFALLQASVALRKRTLQ
ncbi:major facilitator transporter [Roseibium sp. TrichSKD4]|uniref:MFS transporter n=1 Tax=Roseibium sp. TrichSKD4 TaxID=744980 RepID=UPI0001E57799|nr:MFS transporter [Roseibium sp. TrichSKD4]EFO29561.1 major facilitator transporter [Roseibium sp. TrichSKD4]